MTLSRALLVFLLLSSFAFAQPREAASPGLAIAHATIVHTHTPEVQRDATVLIRDGRIERIGASSALEVPQEYRVIDAGGKHLIPGLMDGHIHFFQSGGVYTRPDAIDLRSQFSYSDELDSIRANIDDVFRRYLRCGITAVADAGGPMWNFDVRDAARTSTAAPRVFLTGPLIASYQPEALTTDDAPILRVSTAEEARALVRREAEKKPDFIKVWYIVSERLGLTLEGFRPILEAIVEESHRASLPVWVHATELETARASIEAGADVLVHDVTDSDVDADFLRLARERDVTIVPTLWVFQSYSLVFAGQFSPTPEEFAFADPRILGTLFDLRGFDEDTLPERARALRGRTDLRTPRPTLLQNVKALSDAGVRVAAGTDAGNIGVLHGPSLFREFDLMREAGMSNHDILVSATLHGAALVGREKEFGSVQQGRYADLVLLNSDPLEDIANTADVALVIKEGVVIDPDTLLPPSPEDLAQMQLNAYNARDLEAFLAVYHPEVEVYRFPSTPLFQGREHMREVYEKFFDSAEKLHCRLVGRLTYGATVIDREYVTGIPGKDALEAIAIYEIEGDLIRKVWFVQ